MSLFRKKALDALSTPEQIDQPMQLLRPGYWTLLIALLGFGGSILLWSIFGRLTIRIQGKGVLTMPNNLHLLQSEAFGRVKTMDVDVGMCVKQGETVATIQPVRLLLDEKKTEEELAKLIVDDESEYSYADQRLKLQFSKLDRLAKLAKQGAISLQDLEQLQQETKTLEAQIVSENNRRDQRIQQLQLTLSRIRMEINQTAVVKATQDGCIVGRRVQIGQLVQPATTLFELNATNGNQELKSLGFFVAQDGKRLRLGQTVRVTPTTTKPQRHGGIQGVITKISPLPVSQAALRLKLGDDSTVTSVSQQAGVLGGGLIEITTSLKRDSNTISGYDWGGAKGPNLKLSAGTTTSISVIVEERAPISYVIPLLRNMSGIY